MSRYGEPSSPPLHHHGPLSVVGQEGMPAPAPRPRGPKLKFTPEDDQLLVDLKEKKNLTWKQIAEFFPGRSSGTLQVRYCTKLKAKTTVWTDEMVSAEHEVFRMSSRFATSRVWDLKRRKPYPNPYILAMDHANSSGATGPKVAHRYARVRERPVAHHLVESG
jgi:hypothetical protein